MGGTKTNQFGKGIELEIIGRMMRAGLDCYTPLCDDKGIDVVVRKPDGLYIEVQIKASSTLVMLQDAGLFTVSKHTKQDNFHFIFYIEHLDTMLILSSEEFLNVCSINTNGNTIGQRTIQLAGYRTNKKKGVKEPYIYERCQKYISHDFSRLLSYGG